MMMMRMVMMILMMTMVMMVMVSRRQAMVTVAPIALVTPTRRRGGAVVGVLGHEVSVKIAPTLKRRRQRHSLTSSSRSYPK